MSLKQKEIKENFRIKFQSLLRSELEIGNLFYEIFVEGTAYVVGGFFRDFLNNQQSRDLDVIAEIKHTRLIEIIEPLNIPFQINRHNGIKIFFNKITIDIWCIQNNWAFKNNLVRLNEEDKLLSIAKGCFFNYDALVINLHNFSYNIKFYSDFQKTNQLDILLRSPKYKNLNPTTEANILRAIYIRHTFNSSFSDNTLVYLIKKIGFLKDKYNNEILRLLEIKKKYPKYNLLSEEILILRINEIKNMSLSNHQKLLNL